MSRMDVFTRGLWQDNPVLRLLLGFCPVLAVTTSAIDALGMGLCTLFVLVSSNLAVSSLKAIVPQQMRIPVYIVIIASFVTIVDLVLQGFFYDLSKSLGLFIPLIVVNCIILGRAESFASKNTMFMSLVDALGMGIGFSVALLVLGGIREVFGSGSFFGVQLVSYDTPTVLLFVLPPGAFITLGIILWAMNVKDDRKAQAAR